MVNDNESAKVSRGEFKLRHHTFSAWASGSVDGSGYVRLNIRLHGAAGGGRFSTDGFADKPSAMRAAWSRLEDALLVLAPASYRADHASMMQAAVEADDDRAALTEAWAVISALPEPIARQVWEFSDATGDTFLLRTREAAHSVHALLSGVGGASPGVAEALELLPVDRLQVDVRAAVAVCPELVAMADALVLSVAPGISAYVEAATCSERAEVRP